MAIKSVGIDGCVQGGCVASGLTGWLAAGLPGCWVGSLFCGQSAGCGAVLTLLYNCQFFASACWWAILNSRAARLAWLCVGGWWVCLVAGQRWLLWCCPRLKACSCREWVDIELGWHAAALQYSFERIIDIDEQCCRVATMFQVHWENALSLH